ncbi:CASC3 exon junction complex subunit isoform X2 [Nomia melanderi]|uniref:CASC3 exon junction complex subunit isoform X2 n=1 Tax=Nomia melanderi TaxID=2448451 RepID=UPI00130407CE|nr:protein CASC3-like isoform X2 [Nomia melanderi]
MSDTRRRRKSNQSCGSDDLSDSCEELNATKETQSSEQTDGHQDSECDIYPSDSDVESQDGALRESGDGQEEEKPQKKLDDDEDRRNPQYIPKRGTFYEHDDRTTDEVTETNPETQNERETKEKKVWKDKEDRWDHDRYNDEEQAPKSHEELIAVYGYDIRNEEGPPRARRRRRYGRGPNKYTRNWEDEDAYGKPGTNISNRHRKFNRSGEDFPALGTNKNAPAQVEEPVISSAWYSSKNKIQNKVQNFPPLQTQSDSPKTKSSSTSNAQTNENKAPNEPTNPAWKKDTKHTSHAQSNNGNNGAGGDADKLVTAKTSPRDNNKRNVQESVSLAASRTRGRGFKTNPNNNMVTNRAIETKPKGRGAGPITTENKRNSNIQNDDEQQITHDMKHVSVNDSTQYHQSGRHNKSFYGQSSNQQRSNTVPPRMQQQTHSSPQQQQQQQSLQQDSSANRPKRYSSLRQRPTVAENPPQQNYPPQHGQHGQHTQHNQHNQHNQHSQHNQHNQHNQHSQHNQHNQHNQHGYFPPQGYPQGHFEQTTPVAAAATPLAAQPVIPLPPNGQPASYAPPPFLVPPPQFIPPQTAPPSIINYVPGPNGPAFQPNFQGYQGYTPPVQPQRPPPPQELFQPQGCTYYSPAQQQQQQQQSAPMRRPKAAIPILPPPDNQQHQSTKGRGRSIQSQPTSQPGGIQQTEQEAKTNSVEDEQKTVSEQFDNTQIEQAATPVQEPEKTGDLSAIVETVVENEEKNDVKDDVKDDVKEVVDTDTPVASELVATDSAVETISASDTSKVTVDDENIIPVTPPTVIEKSEIDPVTIESSTAESKEAGPLVEEATA